MYNPVSSYRIQFNRSFRLNDLKQYIDYLDMMGVVSIYASPVFAAVPGSGHGYDVISPDIINPELGTIEDLHRLSQHLKEKNMGWIQDIVPNHMAYHHKNLWLWDVLEKGHDSDFLPIFDVEKAVAEGKEKLMLPFLGKQPDQVITNLEFQVCQHGGSLALMYFDNIFPASFRSFISVIAPDIEHAPDCFRLIWNKYSLGKRESDRLFLNGDWQVVKNEISSFCKTDPAMQNWIDGILSNLNSDPAMLRSFVSLQHYEPCHWQDTSKRINFRRFFTVNGLICLRIEDEKVMKKHHFLIRELVKKGYVQGLRVDHVDGLRDPAEYLRRLRSMAGDNTWIVVEKILEGDEKLQPGWPVQGTSGYEFLALVNNLMVQEKGYRKLLKFWQRFTGEKETPDDIIYRNKKLILNSHMRGELNNIHQLFLPLFRYAEKKNLAAYNDKKNITGETLKEAIGEFMLAFPLYRLYPEEYPLTGETREKVHEIFTEAVSRNADLKNAILLLRDIVLSERDEDHEFNTMLKEFFDRLMQYTGPLTAKGVEDTSMYQYNCFIAGNEVGDTLHPRGMNASDFHEAMAGRIAKNPAAMNCTSTHDTKRGEDVRARLNALGDLADEWIRFINKWNGVNREFKTDVARPGRDTAFAPSPGEEYLIYQTIAGTYPYDENADSDYIDRIREYLVKALREAKQNSCWEEPDEKYEEAVCNFAESILYPESSFVRSFLPFHRKLLWRGIVNSLSQLVIKCCSPGIPDIYRGTENWDLNLVDPDNRRTVDFKSLKANLENITRQWKENPQQISGELFDKSPDGSIKLLLTSILLNERKSCPDLFMYGDYIPLKSGGRFGKNIAGFIRKHRDRWLLCIFPLHSGKLSSKKGSEYFSSIQWKDTHIIMPDGAPFTWEDIFTGTVSDAEGKLSVSAIFKSLPVAVLRSGTSYSERTAGILMHISSLPGEFGTGDMGDQAFRFTEFLSRNSQSYWQTLPLSPVTKSNAWSPYSSPSAFAGNTLLVSPRSLYLDGLLNRSDLEIVRFRNSNRVNYDKSMNFKEILFEKAWERLRKDTGSNLYNEFEKFCRRESYWLEDYALFLACKDQYGGKEWNRWPRKLKERDEKTLKTARYDFAGKITLEKFKQFIFERQWKKLKEYANHKGIKIFGDLPFYVSYDSADVWANQHLFKLKDNGMMKTVAGVPPDYFDKNGQLWNMPVYDWDMISNSGYEWWIKRLAKNLEFFDLLRLDHFRAFSAYWEITAGEKTAVNGKWKRGPGAEFFVALRERFPSMPFVAEDLGDIDQDVYDLKDQFGLPGMQVLQFCFSRDMATSIHTPHNHTFNSLVYTGTHDNNTLRGWYDGELGRYGKGKLHEYTGKKIKASEINSEMIRLAHASPAKLAIVPMQDYMGLGREARMNKPSTSRGNWLWKMKNSISEEDITANIIKITAMYNRCQNP